MKALMAYSCRKKRLGRDRRERVRRGCSGDDGGGLGLLLDDESIMEDLKAHRRTRRQRSRIN